MKLQNANLKKDWKTTITAIIGGILVIAGMVWPDKVDPETQATVNNAFAQILTSVGTLVAVIAGLFGSDA